MKDILETEIEDQIILEELLRFKCPYDSEIEQFLKTKAIPFEKAHKCRTYLVIEDSPDKEGHLKILGYVSVAISDMKIRIDVSKSMRRKLNGIFQNDEVPCYLIGQLGKNEKYSNEIKGHELIEIAINIIRIGQRAVGGRFIRVDCKRNDKLIDFYKKNGFKQIQFDDESSLLQFARFF